MLCANGSVYTVFRRTARLCTISSCAGAIGEAGAAISRYIDQIALKTARLDETSSLNGPHWRHRLNWRLVSECRTRWPGWLRAASSAIKTRRWPWMGRRRVSLWGDFSDRKLKIHWEEIRVPKQEGSTTVRQVQEEVNITVRPLHLQRERRMLLKIHDLPALRSRFGYLVSHRLFHQYLVVFFGIWSFVTNRCAGQQKWVSGINRNTSCTEVNISEKGVVL